jgi:hypothetical protein
VPSAGGLETVAFTAAACPASAKLDTGVCPPLGLVVDPVFFAAMMSSCIYF